MRGAGRVTACLAAILLVTPSVLAQNAKPVPYWVSISASKARIRTGPAITYPATWEYVRPDLPLKVLQVRDDWRRIEDPDGTQGWMKANLLSEQRTALVIGEIRPLRTGPDRAAKIAWRVEPGVVGKIAHCSGGWCELDVRGRAGYIEVAHLWGVSPGETVD